MKVFLKNSLNYKKKWQGVPLTFLKIRNKKYLLDRLFFQWRFYNAGFPPTSSFFKVLRGLLFKYIFIIL